MSLVSFLYRYIFRRLGFLLLIGMLTILALAIHSQLLSPRPIVLDPGPKRHAIQQRHSL